MYVVHVTELEFMNLYHAYTVMTFPFAFSQRTIYYFDNILTSTDENSLQLNDFLHFRRTDETRRLELNWCMQLAALQALVKRNTMCGWHTKKNGFLSLLKRSSWQKGLSPRVHILSKMKILYFSFSYHLEIRTLPSGYSPYPFAMSQSRP